VLEAAEAWGCHPEIVWEGSAVWFRRWQFQRVQKDLKADKDAKKVK